VVSCLDATTNQCKCRPFRVSINAKGGYCWHIFQEKNVLVIDGKKNNNDTQNIDGKNNNKENNNDHTQKSTEEEIRPQPLDQSAKEEKSLDS
jgi:hypothetical protein